MNVHKLKEKKKNITRLLGVCYKKKIAINEKIFQLENAKYNTIVLIQTERNKHKTKKGVKKGKK